MDLSTCLEPCNVVVIYGDTYVGKTQAALRMAGHSGRTIVFLDFSHTLSLQDLAFAGIGKKAVIVRRPENIADGLEFARHSMSLVPGCILVIDPLFAAGHIAAEIGKKTPSLRHQISFLNTIQLMLFQHRGSLIIVESEVSPTLLPAATLFSDFIFQAMGEKNNRIRLKRDAEIFYLAPCDDS